MDIDISDILASVSRPQTVGFADQSHDSSTSFADHQQLVRAWTSERCSPALLPYPSALIDRVMSNIRDQIAHIEDLTSGVSDPYQYGTTTGPSAAGHASSKPLNYGANTNLVLSILQTDLGRTQFIVRSYLRQRLSKISQYAVYYLKTHVPVDGGANVDPTNTSPKPLLSPAEVIFLRNHQALLSGFYDSSFLASFPTNLRRLDDSSGGVNMVEGPDAGTAVVVRCLSERWDNEGEVYGNVSANAGAALDHEEKADVELRFRRGEVWVVRWRDIRAGVVKGDLELL